MVNNENTTATDSNATLFERLYANAKEAMKSLTAPFAKNKIKRIFSSAYDTAAIDAMKAESAINDLYADFDNFDADTMSKIIEYRQRIVEATEAQNIVKAEYALLFGEDMPV